MRSKKESQKGKRKKTGKWKACLLRIILILCIGMFAGGIFETGYELNIHRRELKGGHEAQKESIGEENIQITETVTEEGEKRKLVHITFPERYINKFSYEYSYETTFVPEIKIHTKNVYKNPEIKTIKDICRFNLKESIVNIQDYVTEIKLTVPESAEIGNFVINNQWDFNWYRVAYIGIFVSLILFTIIFRKTLAKQVEYGFLAVSMMCGILFLVLQPPECGSWDEHIHFSKTFDWFENGIADRNVSEYYIYNTPESFDRAGFLSKEEKEQQIEYLNVNADTVATTYERNAFSLNAVGEFHMALAVKVVKHLGMSFYMQFLAGKFANLCLYTLLMFFAIRIAPIGKKFLTVTALMPSIMLQSVSFTYDVVVVGFAALSFSMIIEEFFEINRKLTWKKLLLISTVAIIGSCPKPIYIFLLALILVLPREKFGSVRMEVICKSIVIVICGVMIMTMLLPAASGAVEGDERGGATNVKDQLYLVFHHPFAYIQIFFKDFLGTLDRYFFGSESLGFLAYAGMHPHSSFMGVFCVGVALTEKKKQLVLTKKNMILYKGLLTLIIFGIIGLTWSALYIKFTPVGQTSILGVQARYYLPLLYPLFMVFYTDKIQGQWKEKTYTMVLFLITLWITHGAIYQQYFIPFCQ